MKKIIEEYGMAIAYFFLGTLIVGFLIALLNIV